MAIVETIQAVSAGLTIAKDLRDIGQSLSEAEFKLKLAELMSSLADAKIELAAAQEELNQKDAEIVRLKEAFAFKGSSIEYHGLRYKAHEGQPVGLPFCPVCEADGVFISLTKLEKPGLPGKCPRCKAEYGSPSEFFYPD